MMATRQARLLWLMFIPMATLAGYSLATPIVGVDESRLQVVVDIGDEDHDPVFVVPGLSAASPGPELSEVPLIPGIRGSLLPEASWAGAESSSGRWPGTRAEAGPLSLPGAVSEPVRRWSPSAAMGATAAREALAQSGQAGLAAQIEIDERVAEVARELEQWMVEVIADAFDVQRTERAGQVSLSFAGVEGFHLTKSEGGLALGYDGTTLLAPVRTEDMARQGTQAAAGGAWSSPSMAPRGTSIVAELLRMLTDLLQYPLFWVAIVFLLAGKIAWLVARHWSAEERRAQRRPESRHRHEHRHTHARTVRLPAEAGRPIAH